MRGCELGVARDGGWNGVDDAFRMLRVSCMNSLQRDR
jgi:hypothetical protein